MAEQRLLAVSPNLPCAMDRQEWSLEDYHIVQTLYSGYAAQVYMATCNYSGMEVVLKVYHDVDKAPDVAQHEMYREVAIQSSLQHPNIVHLFAAFEEGDTLVLVQEYIPNGDLLGLMQSHGGRIDEVTVVRKVLQPLLGALMYLHRWGVVHRDVKPENVLFTADGDIKLADFGLAINMIEERPVSRVGTLDYMAPEVLRCPIKQSMAMAPGPNTPAKYGYVTDVWALGIVTYELLTGLPPYASDCRYQAESRICAALPPLFPHYVSPMARDFILRLLAPHPADRPTIREVLQHPWIVQPDAHGAQSRLLVHIAPAVGMPAQGPEPVCSYSRPDAATQLPGHSPVHSVPLPLAHPLPHPPAQLPQPVQFSPSYSTAGQAAATVASPPVLVLPPPSSSPVGSPSPPLSDRSSCQVASVQPSSSPAAVAPGLLPNPGPATVLSSQPSRSSSLSRTDGLDQHLLALHEVDLSDLPLDQIQGMIQKLQAAMQLAVGKQQQAQQQQQELLRCGSGSGLQPTGSSGCGTSPAQAAPRIQVLSSPADSSAADDTHMDDVQFAPERPAASAAAAAKAGQAIADESCFWVQSSCNSPAVPSPALAQSVCVAPLPVPAAPAPVPAARVTAGGVWPPPPQSSYGSCPTGAPASVPAAMPYGAPTVNSPAEAFVPTAAATTASGGHMPFCALSRRVTADCPSPPLYHADAPYRVVAPHSSDRAHPHPHPHHHSRQHLPPYPPYRSPPPQLYHHHSQPQTARDSPPDVVPALPGAVSVGCPMGLSFGVMPARSSGGGLHEGDGLVYVSIGSNRKGAGLGQCEAELMGSARGTPMMWLQ